MEAQIFTRARCLIGSGPISRGKQVTNCVRLDLGRAESMRTLLRAAILSLAFIAVGPARGQTWNTGYFNTASGYGPANSSLSGAPTNVADSFQWKTTDANEVNGMFFRQGWTFGLGNSGNKSVLFGGYNAALSAAYWPAVTNPVLYRNFSNPVTQTSPAVVVSMDFGILPTASALFTNKDVFSFDFINASSDASLLRISLNPAAAAITNGMRLQWSRNGTNVVSDGVTFQAYDIQYNALYRLTATITGNSFDMSILGLAPRGTSTNVSGVVAGITNYAVVGSNWVVDNGPLSGSLTAESFDRFAIDWDLSSGATNQPGGNYMNLNTVSVATTIPEPSTAALLGLSAFGLIAWRLRYRGRRG